MARRKSRRRSSARRSPFRRRRRSGGGSGLSLGRGFISTGLVVNGGVAGAAFLATHYLAAQITARLSPPAPATGPAAGKPLGPWATLGIKLATAAGIALVIRKATPKYGAAAAAGAFAAPATDAIALGIAQTRGIRGIGYGWPDGQRNPNVSALEELMQPRGIEGMGRTGALPSGSPLNLADAVERGMISAA